MLGFKVEITRHRAIPVLLLIVGVPSPSNAGEICVVVDTELLAVGTACNLLHIRIRMTPTHPEKYAVGLKKAQKIVTL